MSERSVSVRGPWICAGLVLLVILPYAQVVSHRFVDFDDGQYVFAQPRVRSGLSWDGVKFAFRGPHGSNWHPLTTLSHMLDVEMFGADVEDAPGHLLVNVGLHALNTLLLFLALRGMTGVTWRPAFVAALFAVHPLRVESVAWASERKDVLSGLCFMLVLLCWKRYAREPTAARLATVAAVFALGLLAKPMLVTVPFVLLLLDVWPLERGRPALREKIPLFALSAISAALTLAAQQRSLASLDRLHLAWRIVQAPIAGVTYVWKTLWPSGLACLHPHPASLPGASLQVTAGLAFVAALALGGTTWLVLRKRREQPYLAVGWLWFLVMLAPVIGVVQVGRQAWADRYAYLPTIGLYVLVAWSATEVWRRWGRGGLYLRIAAAGVVLALLPVTCLQVRTWKDTPTLYGHALRVTRDNAAIRSAFGAYRMHEGNLAEAKLHLDEALRVWPQHVKALTNLGSVLERQGDLVGARARYAAALRADSRSAIANNRMGSLLLREGDLANARSHYERAIASDPELAPAVRNLGIVMLRQGDLRSAQEWLERAIRLGPDPVAWLNLGLTRAAQGDNAGARAAVERALALRPDYPDARETLERLSSP